MLLLPILLESYVYSDSSLSVCIEIGCFDALIVMLKSVWISQSVRVPINILTEKRCFSARDGSGRYLSAMNDEGDRCQWSVSTYHRMRRNRC